MKIARVSQMRDMDRMAIERYGIREELLMENAGEAVYFALSRRYAMSGKRFAVFCGGGNNGGDGFVVARKLHAAGAAVDVCLLADPERFSGAAQLNREIVMALGLPVKRIVDAGEAARVAQGADVMIDAIFGTGLAREVSGIYLEVIEAVNRCGKPVVSVDIPSGVQGDTGRVMGAAVKADLTVTFGLPKIGNLLYPGYDLCGDLFVTHISFPPELQEAPWLDVALNLPGVLPPRDPDGHKGSFGQALFICGAASYYGAPFLAAYAFLRAGGGYSRLAVPAAMAPFIAVEGREIVLVPMAETSTGSISEENADGLLTLSEDMEMVVMGPGLSLDQETQRLVVDLAVRIERPLLLDGDGITAVCRDLDCIRHRKAPTVLTPHPGEMARIAGVATAEIQADRVAAVQKAARDLGVHIVLKGAHSLIGCPDGRVYVNLSGNSGMGSAGSGDVLTGAIAAMLGLGLGFEEAVLKGVFIHGLAGDLVAQSMGEDGMTARDVLEHLPQAVRLDREGRAEDVLGRSYRGPIII